MAEKILLLGHGKTGGLAMMRTLAALGYEPSASSWKDFNPRKYGRDHPLLVIIDADRKNSTPMDRFADEVRRLWGESFPVMALTSSNKFSDLSALLDAGASACVPRDAAPRMLDMKISRCLADSSRIRETADDDEVPPHLLGVFGRRVGLVELGDLAGVYAGAASRRSNWRRMAPPDYDWRGVMTSECVDRFHAGKPESYLWWNRLALFRMPEPAEYDVSEKVLLRRAGPPLAAAVDRSRLPAGADVYSLVPAEGVGAAFIACILNSRLMDFYFNRVARIGFDGRLRLDDIRRAPFPRPEPDVMREMNRMAALLSHFGPHPQTWIDRQTRGEVVEQMENLVFSLYGAGTEVQNDLSAMHF